MDPAAAPVRSRLRRLLPLGLLVLALAAFFLLGLDQHLSFSALGEHRALLTDLVASRPVVAATAFMLVYAVAVAASLPGGVVLSIAGGLLFGPWLGTVYVVVAATVGASALFPAARTALGDLMRRRMGKLGQRLEQELRENAFGYLLVLRLMPLFPFWLVNLVPALAGVPLRTYVAATALGIIPGTAVFVGLGSGLGAVFDRGETPDLAQLLSAELLLPLVGLALLAALPLLYRKWTARSR